MTPIEHCPYQTPLQGLHLNQPPTLVIAPLPLGKPLVTYTCVHCVISPHNRSTTPSSSFLQSRQHAPSEMVSSGILYHSWQLVDQELMVLTVVPPPMIWYPSYLH